MTSKTLRHLSHYIVLLIIMLAGLVAMIVSGRSTLTHTVILILLSFGYFLWGIVHHFLEKDLHLEVVLEYFIMGILGLAFVFGVLYYL